MSCYEITLSVTALCPCCGKDRRRADAEQAAEVLTKTDLARIYRMVMAGATRFSEGEYLLMRAVERAAIAKATGSAS